MKFLALGLGVVISTIAMAAPQTLSMPVVCDNTGSLLENITKLGERVIWAGTTKEGNAVVTITQHPVSHEWTIIQFNQEVACVLRIGEKGKQLLLPTQQPSL